MLTFGGKVITSNSKWIGDLVYRVIITQPTGGTISTEEFVHPGDTVTLDNTPDTGWQFDHYTLDGEPIEGNTFTMPEHDVEISVVFTQITYNITVNSGSHGTITAPTTAHYGDTVTITAMPDYGWLVDHYTLDGEPIVGNTFIMPEHDVTISAVFTTATFSILITQVTHGTISAPSTGRYGDTITISSTPDSTYEIDHYTVNGTPITGNTFTMPASDVVISAVFTQITYNITVNSGSHGTITAPTTAHYGDTITLTGTVDDGYALDHYTVNGTPITGNTFTMPASDVVISAEYYARTYSISKTNPSGGTITVPSSAVYGSTVTISISTTADWVLNYFTVDGVQISGNTFTMPAHNVTVSAVLKAATRTYRSDFIFISPYPQFNTCYDLSALAAGSGVSVNMYVWVFDGLLANGSWKRWSRYGDSLNVNCSIDSISPFTLTDSNKNVMTVHHTSDPYTVGGTYVRFEFSADHDIQLYLSNFREEYLPSTGSVTARYYTGNYDRTGSPAQTGMTTVYTADPFIIGTKKV